jgi:isochorismate pyruvate lyase
MNKKSTNQVNEPEVMMEECVTLEQVRQHIDRIDKNIVPLLVERNHYVMQAAKLKGDVNAARVPKRIEEVVKKVRLVAESRDSNPEIVESIYRAMIEINIELESKTIKERYQKNK